VTLASPPKIALPDRLQSLVKYCEKSCVAECCGRDAFDLSPLHIASYLSAYTGQITEHDIGEWEQQVDQFEESVAGLTPNAEGLVCSIKGMNQFFRRDDLEALLAELRNSIRVAPRIVELSDQLRLPPNPS
jgi:hypothetical protein